MLTAVGIDNEMELDGDAYAVRVEAVAHAHALHHLAQYEQERGAVAAPEPQIELQPRAWIGSLVYALVLLFLPLAKALSWWPADPYASGVLDPVQMQAGQWWRAWTALTLHWDASHLLGNLGAGILLGHSAAQIWGNSRAWLLIITAAAAANLVEGGFNGAGYVSAGASTAVFAALGLVTAWSWRTRRRYAHNWWRRLAPLVAGLVVLALTGGGDGQPVAGAPVGPSLPGMQASDGHTNVLSHVLGFATGALVGVMAAGRGERWLGSVPAWAATALVLGQVAVAWSLALTVG